MARPGEPQSWTAGARGIASLERVTCFGVPKSVPLESEASARTGVPAMEAALGPFLAHAATVPGSQPGDRAHHRLETNVTRPVFAGWIMASAASGDAARVGTRETPGEPSSAVTDGSVESRRPGTRGRASCWRLEPCGKLTLYAAFVGPASARARLHKQDDSWRGGLGSPGVRTRAETTWPAL